MSKNSKKDRIIELVNKGKTAKEVANMLNTSESYVNKVKSISRTELSILSDSKSEEMFVPINPNVEGTNKQTKVRSRSVQLSSMTPAMRKSFYRWLDAEKSPADFIKRTGVDGRVLEEEYETYLKWKDADRIELQKRLLALVEDDEYEKESILSGSPSLLSNTSLVNLLKKRLDENKDWEAKRTMVKYSIKKDTDLLFWFRRALCSSCENELMGVLIYKRLHEDPDLVEHLNSVCLCPECRSTSQV